MAPHRNAEHGAEPFPTTPEHAIVTMELIDDIYDAAGLPLRPTAHLR